MYNFIAATWSAGEFDKTTVILLTLVRKTEQEKSRVVNVLPLTTVSKPLQKERVAISMSLFWRALQKKATIKQKHRHKRR